MLLQCDIIFFLSLRKEDMKDIFRVFFNAPAIYDREGHLSNLSPYFFFFSSNKISLSLNILL